MQHTYSSRPIRQCWDDSRSRCRCSLNGWSRSPVILLSYLIFKSNGWATTRQGRQFEDVHCILVVANRTVFGNTVVQYMVAVTAGMVVAPPPPIWLVVLHTGQRGTLSKPDQNENLKRIADNTWAFTMCGGGKFMVFVTERILQRGALCWTGVGGV